MLRVILEANVPLHEVEGLKEDIAMYCEKHGDVRIVQIDDDSKKPTEQMRMGGM